MSSGRKEETGEHPLQPARGGAQEKPLQHPDCEALWQNPGQGHPSHQQAPAISGPGPATHPHVWGRPQTWLNTTFLFLLPCVLSDSSLMSDGFHSPRWKTRGDRLPSLAHLRVLAPHLSRRPTAQVWITEVSGKAKGAEGGAPPPSLPHNLECSRREGYKVAPAASDGTDAIRQVKGQAKNAK